MHSPPPEHEKMARGYLATQLGSRAPIDLSYEGTFAEHPLEGEGPTSLFSFALATQPHPPGGCAAADLSRHYVAVGQTEPNYFPAYGLTADDGYSFHIGTRFMLEMEVRLVEPELEPPSARAALTAILESHARGAAVGRVELAALFRCQDEFLAVYRVRIDERDVYCMGADCPPGFYALVQFAPQVALRLHLGKLIRAEAQAAGERAR